MFLQIYFGMISDCVRCKAALELIDCWCMTVPSHSPCFICTSQDVGLDFSAGTLPDNQASRWIVTEVYVFVCVCVHVWAHVCECVCLRAVGVRVGWLTIAGLTVSTGGTCWFCVDSPITDSAIISHQSKQEQSCGVILTLRDVWCQVAHYLTASVWHCHPTQTHPNILAHTFSIRPKDRQTWGTHTHTHYSV